MPTRSHPVGAVRKVVAPLLAAAALTSFGTACSRPPDRAGDASTHAPLVVASAAAAPPTSASATRAGGGWAYLLGRQPSPPAGESATKPAAAFVETLVAIDPSGAVARVTAPTGRVVEVRRGSDGIAYALTTSSARRTLVQVLRLSGSSAESLGDVPDCRLATSDTAFDVRGDRVVVGCPSGRLTERRGDGAWTTIDLPAAGPFPSVWISKAGTLWYGAVDGLHERTGETWTSRKLPGANNEPLDLLDGPEGIHVTVRGTGLFRVSGQELLPVWPHGPSARVLFASSNGTTGSFDEFRPSVRLDTLASAGTAVKPKAALSFRSSVDDRGRVWGVRDGQLVVADARTGDAEVVPMGTYAELDYIEPQRIVLLGEGPRTPAPRTVRKTKRIEMRIASGDRPAANAEVELCPRPFAPSLGRGPSPCKDVAPSLVVRARTDAQGNVAIDDVVMGGYHAHWKVGDAWQRGSAMVPLREGELSNAGTVSPSGP